MRKIWIILTIAALMTFTAAHSFAATNSVSYKVSFTIPAVVGVNVDVTPQANSETQTTTAIDKTDKLTALHEIKFEEIVRNYENVTLKTIVVK